MPLSFPAQTILCRSGTNYSMCLRHKLNPLEVFWVQHFLPIKEVTRCHGTKYQDHVKAAVFKGKPGYCSCQNSATCFTHCSLTHPLTCLSIRTPATHAES